MSVNVLFFLLMVRDFFICCKHFGIMTAIKYLLTYLLVRPYRRPHYALHFVRLPFHLSVCHIRVYNQRMEGDGKLKFVV